MSTRYAALRDFILAWLADGRSHLAYYRGFATLGMMMAGRAVWLTPRVWGTSLRARRGYDHTTPATGDGTWKKQR